MSKSLEALDKIVEKYDWLGKEYCRLIGKGDELHKVNQTAFVECLVTPIKHDLERKEELEKENLKLKQDILSFEDYSYDLDCEKQQLEKENQELKEKYKRRAETSHELCEALKMYETAIEILKEHIHICRNSCFYKIVLNGETELSLLDYELIKEVLSI